MKYQVLLKPKHIFPETVKLHCGQVNILANFRKMQACTIAREPFIEWMKTF